MRYWRMRKAMNNEYGDYKWKPSHDIQKPNLKVGQKVLHRGMVKTITHVDRHVYPICVDGERVSLEDVTRIDNE